MADLHVSIAGVPLKNPVITASGTFGFGREYSEFYPLSRLGGISTKGLTLLPRSGNPPPRIAESPSGMLNAVGLQNPGVEHFISHDLPWLEQQDTAIIANIAGSCPEDYCRMAERLSETSVHMIELNISISAPAVRLSATTRAGFPAPLFFPLPSGWFIRPAGGFPSPLWDLVESPPGRTPLR